MDTSAAFGHPLGQKQRNQRATKAKNGTHDQQRTEVEVDTIFRQDTLQPQQIEYDADQHQYRDIGAKKQKNSHDRLSSFIELDSTL